MTFFAWDQKYALNIQEVDAQHKKLIALVDKLFTAMQAGKANDVLGPVLNELITYTAQHFSAEERLMKTFGYPDFASHKAEHDALTKKALDLQQQFKSGKITLSLEVGKFLKDWLNNHIQLQPILFLGVFATSRSLYSSPSVPGAASPTPVLRFEARGSAPNCPVPRLL